MRTHLLQSGLSATVILPLLACAMLTGCSVQKRTTAPGWHVEKCGKAIDGRQFPTKGLA